MTTAHVSDPRLPAALEDLAATFGDLMLSGDAGGSFTCSEADTLARVLALAGRDDAAALWLAGHALGDDDEGDRHAHLVNEDAAGVDVNRSAALQYVRDLLED